MPPPPQYFEQTTVAKTQVSRRRQSHCSRCEEIGDSLPQLLIGVRELRSLYEAEADCANTRCQRIDFHEMELLFCDLSWMLKRVF